MRAVVVGGGKVGYYLIRTLIEKKCDVILIEKDIEICNKFSTDFNIDVICGDGSDIQELSKAIEWNSDIVAAVTGKDEENLIICEMAKENFKIKKTIARINNPKNRLIFKTLGVDATVCSTEVISRLIENELSNKCCRVIQTFERGSMVLLEFIIDKYSNWCNSFIKDIKFPKDSIIVSIYRNDEVIFPRGNVTINENDHIYVMTTLSTQSELKKSIYGDI